MTKLAKYNAAKGIMMIHKEKEGCLGVTAVRLEASLKEVAKCSEGLQTHSCRVLPNIPHSKRIDSPEKGCLSAFIEDISVPILDFIASCIRRRMCIARTREGDNLAVTKISLDNRSFQFPC